MNKETVELIKRIERLENKLELTTPKIEWHKIGDLLWSDNLGKMNWDEAMAKAKELGARLPERWEMIKVTDKNHDELQELVENDPSYNFWSATETTSTNAWNVNLNNGYTGNYGKASLSFQVRCVR
jgi:hypothetical protein